MAASVEKLGAPYLGKPYPSKTKRACSNQPQDGVSANTITFRQEANCDNSANTDAKGVPAIYGLGIDTLILNMRVAAWRPKVIELLKQLKHLAFQTVWPEGLDVEFKDGEPEKNMLPTIDLGGQRFYVRHSGKVGNHETPHGNYNFWLSNRLFDVFISLRAHQVTTPEAVVTLEPLQSPNARVEVRSYALWTLGLLEARQCVKQVFDDLSLGRVIDQVSQVDLCCDTSIKFTKGQRKFIVCRATKGPEEEKDLGGNVVSGPLTWAEYEELGDFTGWRVTSADIIARIYRKDIEIKRSGKTWMYDIHGIEPGTEFWRIEFAIRRTVLREMGVEDFASLLDKRAELWGYMTQRWFSFRRFDNERTARRSFTNDWMTIINAPVSHQWTDVVKAGTRDHSRHADTAMLIKQCDGVFSSLANYWGVGTRDEVIAKLISELNSKPDSKARFAISVENKRAKIDPAL